MNEPKMDAAQHPASEGGKLITPREAERIRMRVLKSALPDNEAAGLADKCLRGSAGQVTPR